MISIWQRFLSYLFPITLEKVQSNFSEGLKVQLSGGKLMLGTDEATYSFEERYTSFAHAFKQIDWANFKPKNNLVLGFGLGSIPIILSRNHQINCLHSGIEIDEGIIEAANKYFPFEEVKNVEIIYSDAFEWVEKCNTKFDLINIDLFIDLQIPSTFQSEAFIQSIKTITHDESIVLFSWVEKKAAENKPGLDYYHTIFKENFEHCRQIRTAGNLILASGRWFL